MEASWEELVDLYSQPAFAPVFVEPQWPVLMAPFLIIFPVYS